MNRRMSLGAMTALLAFSHPVAFAAGNTAVPLVLPHPQELQVGQRQVTLARGCQPRATIVVDGDDPGLGFAAQWLSDRAKAVSGVALSIAPKGPGVGAILRLHRPGSPEAAALVARYKLQFGRSPDPKQVYAIVTEGDCVHIVAPAATGVVYGAYTLAQLITGKPGECGLSEVRVFDYPAAPVRGMLWLRGDDDYRHAYSQWAASCKINTYTWYVDWNAPLTQAFRDILRDCSLRGMTLVPTISWFQNNSLRYSSAAYVDPMLARVREALDAGAGAFGFNFDDNPLRVFGEDEKAYPSLIAAQADLLNKVHKITGPAGAGLFFCPTIYWKPYAGAQGDNLADQYAYVRGMGQHFPPGVRTFTTSIDKGWAEEYVRLTGHKPVFWHNFFPNDMADWKLYFEPYPCLPAELVPRCDGVFVLGGWQTDWWKVNYLTFACNTWNPTHPCTLAEAFRWMYPMEAGKLARYAVLLGSHNEPARKMEWDGTHPHQTLRPETFFNLDPTPTNLASLKTRLSNATEAERIARDVATRSAVPAAQAKELVAAAERMRINYQMALTACEVRQLEQAGDRNRLASAETERKIDAARAQGDELEKVIKDAGWPTSACSDLALKSYFDSLKTRLRSGQGTTPRLIAVRCDTPPVIDGRLDEKAWGNAPVSTQFYNIEGSPRPAGQQTEVRVLFDDHALYLGFTCHEDRMTDLKAVCTRHDDPVWEDDSVEVFVDSLRSRKNYDHFVVNTRGTQYEERVKDGTKDAAWDGKWTAATQKTDTGWTAEIALPFATLGVAKPTSTQRMGINVTREEVPHGEVSAWALTFGSFHQPGMFGDLAFGQAPQVVWVEAEKVAKTNFLYGVQLAADRTEAHGTNGTGYLNLNVAHPNGPPGDPPDGSPCWYATWQIDCPKSGEYALWVLGSDQPTGVPTWQWDNGPQQAERRPESVAAPESYARPLGLSRWYLIAGARASVALAAGRHALTLRVRAKDPAQSKRASYFLDTLVIAPPGWKP